MDVSIIITAYNSPVWMEKVLWGYAAQSDLRFEIILANDGSSDAYREAIDNLASKFEIPIRHIWQPGSGFRKSLILNKAIRECNYEYVVFCDGDCVPCSDFVLTHKRLSRKGHFLAGGYVTIPLGAHGFFTKECIESGHAFKGGWLQRRGGVPGGACSSRRTGFWRIMDFGRSADLVINTRNCSVWRDNLIRANGFDNRMSYGGEGRELGLRLGHLAVQGRNIGNSAHCVRLDSSRSYFYERGNDQSYRIHIDTGCSRSVSTPAGLSEIDLGRHND